MAILVNSLQTSFNFFTLSFNFVTRGGKNSGLGGIWGYPPQVGGAFALLRNSWVYMGANSLLGIWGGITAPKGGVRQRGIKGPPPGNKGEGPKRRGLIPQVWAHETRGAGDPQRKRKPAGENPGEDRDEGAKTNTEGGGDKIYTPNALV